jgi:Arc/MetJ-type ribon-helix-helix transcriptional regulator
MTTKLAISLPDEHVVAARQAVAEGRATSVSAYIADSLSERIRHDQITDLLADMAAESGPPSDDDRQWARSALGLD